MCLALACSLALPGPACVIPPNLAPDDGDAGPSSPPVILEAGPAPDFSFPGPMQLQRPDTRELSLIVRDQDVDDVLYLRLYVDYERPSPTPAWAECQAAPTGDPTRVAICPVSALCNPIQPNDPGDHYLDVMVADRPFISDVDPAAVGQKPYRAVADFSQAGTSLRQWLMRCEIDEG
jgi:hypothetical protein